MTRSARRRCGRPRRSGKDLRTFAPRRSIEHGHTPSPRPRPTTRLRQLYQEYLKTFRRIGNDRVLYQWRAPTSSGGAGAGVGNAGPAVRNTRHPLIATKAQFRRGEMLLRAHYANAETALRDGAARRHQDPYYELSRYNAGLSIYKAFGSRRGNAPRFSSARLNCRRGEESLTRAQG